MRAMLTVVLLSLAAMAAQAQDFETGIIAFERQDYNTALRSFGAAAEANDADAQYMLGRLYARGLGVLQDFVEAHRWYNIAAANGQRFAAAARDALAEKMTPEQIASAHELARMALDETDETDATYQPAPGSEADDPVLITRATVVGDEELSESTIARIQMNLRRLEYDVEVINGQLDEVTRNAIRAYQTDNQLPINGKPTAALLGHLEGKLQGQIGIQRSGQPPASAPAQPQEPPANTQWRRLL